MYAALASIFFSLTAFGALATIAVSLSDNAAEIRQALGVTNTGKATMPAYFARISRTSQPYRQARPAPAQFRAAA